MFYTSVPSVYDLEKVESVLEAVNDARQLLKNIDAVLLGEMMLDVDTETNEIVFIQPKTTRDKICLVAIINEYDADSPETKDNEQHPEP